MTMRSAMLSALAALSVPAGASAQEIVKVPETKANVSRPDDLFNLPSGQWFVAKQLWHGGRDPCDAEGCEAGFNSGDLVVSVEHAKGFVQAIAGFRNCQSVGFSEVEVGDKADSYERSRVSDLVKKVVKALEKTCSMKAPAVPKLDVASMFPKRGTT
ncbi:MAG: hypothetical protein ACJ8FN_01445 [Sphingomicrobium sp.]